VTERHPFGEAIPSERERGPRLTFGELKWRAGLWDKLVDFRLRARTPADKSVEFGVDFCPPLRYIYSMNLELNNEMRQRLSEVCKRYGVRRLSIFGSVRRDEDLPGSDLDVLVEFEPDRTPGLAFITLQDELSAIFGRNVDLNTPDDLSKYFRTSVVKEARQIYAAP